MALLGRLQIPAIGGNRIAFDAVAVEKQVAVIILPPVVAGLSRPAVPVPRLDDIDRHAPAVLAAAAEHVHGVGIVRAGGGPEPAHRRGFVFRHAGAVEQHPAEPHLRLAHAALGRDPDPAGGDIRRPAQQLMQFVARHPCEPGSIGLHRRLFTGPHPRRRPSGAADCDSRRSAGPRSANPDWPGQHRGSPDPGRTTGCVRHRRAPGSGSRRTPRPGRRA